MASAVARRLWQVFGCPDTLALEALVEIGDGPDDAGGISHDDHAGRHVAGNHPAGSDQCSGADFDSGQQHHPRTDLRPGPHDRSPQMTSGDFVARHEIVGEDRARSDEDIVLQDLELGDVDVAVNSYSIADGAAVVDG